MSTPRDFYGRSADPYPDMVGLENCKSLFTHMKKTKMIKGKFLARHFVAIQRAIEIQELDNAHWVPGRENPADGLTKLDSE